MSTIERRIEKIERHTAPGDDLPWRRIVAPTEDASDEEWNAYRQELAAPGNLIVRLIVSPS